MSVLTAWAAGKFSAGTIKKFFDEFDIENKVKSRTLIIPGKVAVMKGEIEAACPAGTSWSARWRPFSSLSSSRTSRATKTQSGMGAFALMPLTSR